MKDQKEKSIKEPFSPEHTPNPPQIIDPSRGNELGEGQKPLKTEPTNQKQEGTTDANKNSSKKTSEATPQGTEEAGD